MPGSKPWPSRVTPASCTTTRAPRAASNRTYASPSPRPLPVTMATWSSKRIILAFSFFLQDLSLQDLSLSFNLINYSAGGSKGPARPLGGVSPPFSLTPPPQAAQEKGDLNSYQYD